PAITPSGVISRAVARPRVSNTKKAGQEARPTQRQSGGAGLLAFHEKAPPCQVRNSVFVFFSSPSFLRIARSSNLQRPSLPFPHLRTALPSEPGPVKAERSDRREQASRRVALTGGSDGAPLVMREWQAAQRRCTLSSRRSRLLSLLPVRRVRLLPFALLSS